MKGYHNQARDLYVGLKTVFGCGFPERLVVTELENLAMKTWSKLDCYLGIAAFLEIAPVQDEKTEYQENILRLRREDQEARLEKSWTFGCEGKEVAQGCSCNFQPSNSLSLILIVGNLLHDGQLHMTRLQAWHIRSN
jgi:hypothetical protein